MGYCENIARYTGGVDIINRPIITQFDCVAELLLFGLKLISRKGSTVSQTEDPFSATRSSVRWTPL